MDKRKTDNRNTERLFQIADDLKASREQKKKLEAEVEDLTRKIEALDLVLSNLMADAELENFSRSGSTFYLTSRLFASPREGRREEMMKALKDHGFGSLVIETVNAQTLASFCREQKLLSGPEEKMPGWLDEFVNTYEKVSVGIRKKGKGREHGNE